MSSLKPLAGKVCLVTGASRGIGKGIALQLGEAGATVYITGRSLLPPKDNPVGGSLKDTAKEIENRGGRCIPVQCDHSKDSEVERLFEQLKQEQDGQLDILVNNAYTGVRPILENMRKPFFEQPLSIWDDINNVGLRNHYMCSVQAARLMVPRNSGLIVNISSYGGLRYLFNVAYGIGKEACDRMAADCAFELRKHKVAFVSLWPGTVKTEMITYGIQNETIKGKFKEMFDDGESPEFPGKCIVKLAQDPNLMKKSGKVLLTADLGNEYGFLDIDGHKPASIRQVNYILNFVGMGWIARFIPNFVRLPGWMIHTMGNKL